MGIVAYLENIDDQLKFKITERKEAEPQADEILIKHEAIGVNALTSALYNNLPANNKVCGIEACGIIEKLGKNVHGFKIGQRVAYVTYDRGGAYAQYNCVHQKYLISIPPELDAETVAATLFKGLSAHYLVHRVFIIRAGVAALIHSAAGGIGHILAQWCNHLGAVTIGSVSTKEKYDFASNYCHLVVDRSLAWEQAIKDYTKIGVNVVYDSIGNATFAKSLSCLMQIGLMVLFEQARDEVKNIDLASLQANSLFITSPSFTAYKSNRMELLLSAEELFRLIINQTLKIHIAAEFPLQEVNQAHQLLEANTSMGSIILIP